MNDWLCIRLKCQRVLTWLLKDYHGNEMDETGVNGSVLDVPECSDMVTGGLP